MAKYTLTQSNVDRSSCPAGKAKLDVFDTKVTGFLLTCLPSGKKTYSIRTKGIEGTIIHRRIGDAAILSLDQARTMAIGLLSQLAMGQDPFKPAEKVITVSDLVVDYMNYIQNYKRSWKTDESLLRNHILPAFGKQLVSEVSKQDVIKFCSLHRQTHAPGSVNRVLILLRYLFNLALRWEVYGVRSNPTAGIPLLEENNKKDRYLSEEETLGLFSAVQASDNKLLQFIIPMLILTGARKREVLDAKWEDFDHQKRLWRIPMSKSGKARYVPISEGVVNILKHIPRATNCPFVFANPDTHKPYVSIFCSWDTARKKAGLTEVRIHDLRHSFASFLVNNGRSLYEVQKLLGHTQIKTTQRYAHLANDTLLDAANLVSRIIPIGQSMPVAANDINMVTVQSG